MKTLEQLKQAVDYRQDDETFLSYLLLLEKHGVIAITAGDINVNASTVSDDFFSRLAAVYGVQLDNNFNPVRQMWGK